MTSSTERVFIFGGTGNVGTVVVKDLIAKNIPVTLCARTPSSAESWFSGINNDGLIKIVQGDYDDLNALKANLPGHNRLFLLVIGAEGFVEQKINIAKIAYEAGIKQIVDVSSSTVNIGWRTSIIGASSYNAEKGIYELPHRECYVALRPTRFMSNLLRAPVTDGKIYEHIPADRAQGWISTNDIGTVAAVVLSEDIHKHGDAVYTLVGDVCTPTQRAEIFSRLAGKEITYQQTSPAQRYKAFISWGVFGHNVCMDLCGVGEDYDDARVSNEISILLGREPETLEQYIATKKSVLFH